MKRAEAASRNTGYIVVIDELIDRFLKRRQIPPAATNALKRFIVDLALPDAVAVGRGDFRNFPAGRRKIGLIPWRKAPFGAIRVVPARVHPRDNRRTRVE